MSLAMRRADERSVKLMDEAFSNAPGDGVFRLYGFGSGGLSGGVVGGGLGFSARLSQSWAAFANGQLGYGFGARSGLEGQVMLGIGARW